MERWQQLESLFQEALRRPVGERDAWLRDACAPDAELHQEVASLLANHHESAGAGPWAAAAAQLMVKPVLLEPGRFLGPYQIVSFLAAGGMGEVYRARDTKLKRDVALKVLPEKLARDPGRMARFQREAEVLASLNHPNIAHIYGVEERALVMEFVEGESSKGPMPFEDAWKIASQIAEGLNYAHEKGVVHRDLKPSNIKVTPEGVVKLLDFGLAKAYDNAPDAEGVDPTESPTVTLGGTAPGVILGTAPYMSPEQARGKSVDQRADIWAFGVVFYQLLTGKQLFRGEDLTDTLASIVKEQPDLRAVPQRVRKLLAACLEKDSKKRLQSVGDIHYLLEGEPAVATRPLAWALAGVFAALVLVVSLAYLGQKPPEGAVIRSEILPPPEKTFSRFTVPALSPDGRSLVFSAQSADGKDQLWVRSLDMLAAQPLAGTDNGRNPFWSPDSKSIGFFADGMLKKIEAAGGPVLTLAAGGLGQGTWNAEGVIVLGSQNSELWKVSTSGGDRTPVTKLDRPKESTHNWPWFLPDGRHFLFSVISNTGDTHRAIRLGSLDSPETRTLMEADSNAEYAQGHLLFLRGTTLMAQPFNPKSMSLTGEPVFVADQVWSAPQFAAFSVSVGQELIYASGGVVAAAGLELAWFDRTGTRVGTLGTPAAISRLFFSPDRKNLTLSFADPSSHNSDIQIFDVAQGLPRRFSFDPAQELYAVWSPDGKSIVFNSDRRGHFDLYRKAANGAADEELLYWDNLEKYPTSWSPDGKYLLYYTLDEPNNNALWVLPDPMGPPRSSKPYRLGPGMFGQFSTDGKWVAYRSSGSGAAIYAARFPGPGGKQQISRGGGNFPRWRSNGKEIFYIRAGGQLMAAEVAETGDTLEVGKVTRLFSAPVPTGNGYPYDVSADGQHFLMIVPPEQSNSESLKLVQNWTARLKK
jgi:serine/threonine protein kinase